MTTRRNFIKALASLPPVLAYRPAWAQNKTGPDPSRLALVIGNSEYPSSPLGNPVNDAKAVTTLLTQAGFTVNSLLNATRQDMTTGLLNDRGLLASNGVVPDAVRAKLATIFPSPPA